METPARLPEFSAHVEPSAYLTEGVPGTGGVLRQRPEDFIVEEIPAYEPCGSGEHIYLFIEKRDLPTLRLLEIVAGHFGVPRHAVGFAGLKDRRAVTRQLISVHTPGKGPADFPPLERPDMRVLWADLHTNKLRRGHLKGNRFVIRIREVQATAALRASRVLRELDRRGVPNRTGEQRFGLLGNNHLVGRALMLGHTEEALDLVLGPSPRAPERQREARELYVQGKYADALHAFDRGCTNERRVLGDLARGRKRTGAIFAMGQPAVSFFITAFQSAVFNVALDGRLRAGLLESLIAGDLAFKHDNGAVFAVDEHVLADPETARRLREVEISPSGAMWAPGMTRAKGEVDDAEVSALERSGVTLEQLHEYGRRLREPMEGARRPLRVPLTLADAEGGLDEHGQYVRVAFELPRGAFATVVMREIMKAADAQPEDEPTPDAAD